MEIVDVDPEELKIPSWHATYILRPDLLVLADSLGSDGVISPIVVQSSSGNIIDGTQRVRLILGNKHLRKLFPTVPVVYKDVNDVQAMSMHIQLNRGRGSLVAKSLSSIIRTLFRSRAMTAEDLTRKFNMRGDEVELMLNPSILKQRKVKDHTYSRAWVPVEAPPGSVDSAGQTIETPPNKDR